MNILQ